MRRFKDQFPIDEPVLEDGDAGFVGVSHEQPLLLEAGQVATARNARFSNGKAEPRLGLKKLIWPNQVPAGTSYARPFGQIWGAGVYRDPNDVEWVIMAADGKVFKSREGAGPVELNLPPGEAITYEVSFTQTYNGMIMFRGEARAPLYLRRLDVGFEPVGLETNVISNTEENPSDGTEAIPNAASGEWIGNRVFIPYSTASEKDLLAISDYLNATRYSPTRNQARINQGSSDRLVRFAKFNEFTGVAFKERSIYALYNIQYDLVDMTQDEVTSEFGLVAPFSVVQAGRDADKSPSMLWFLSDKRGISSLVFGEYGRLQVEAVPVSRPIRRLIDRIDWRYARQARAAWWDNKVYFAVPLDSSNFYVPVQLNYQAYVPPHAVPQRVVPGGRYRWIKREHDVSLTNGSQILYDSDEFIAQETFVYFAGDDYLAPITAGLDRVYPESNNAILVYDFMTGAWAGCDDGPAVGVKEFFKTTYNGAVRLFYLSVDGFVNLIEDGFFDEVIEENMPEVVEHLGNYSADGIAYMTVVPGQQYAYSLGVSDTSIINGTQTLADLYGSFVAQTAQLTYTGEPLAEVGTLLYPVYYPIVPGGVDFEILTRGYSGRSVSRKLFTAGRVQVETWDPCFTVAAKMDGANEEYILKEDVTKSATRYYKPFSKPPWDETNVNDDHATPHREDYRIQLGCSDYGVLSGEIQPDLEYYLENLTGQAGIIYNNTYLAPDSLFTGVADVTVYGLPEQNLIAYWLLEEAAGNRVDAKGNNDLQPFNAPGRNTGVVGYAVHFTATNQVLYIATNTDLEMGDINFTICGWFRFDTVAGSARKMMGKGYAGDTGNEYCLAVTGAPQTIKFFVNNGASAGTVDSGLTPATGTWYFVVAWHDATSNKIGIQINNATAIEAAHSAGVPVGTRNFTLGEESSTGQPFLGRIDLAMVHKRLLTASERTALYNAGAGLLIGLGGSPLVRAPGQYVFFGENGIDPDLHQEFTQQLPMDGHEQGKFLQLRVTNNQGRCALLSCDLESQETDRRMGVHA